MLLLTALIYLLQAPQTPEPPPPANDWPASRGPAHTGSGNTTGLPAQLNTSILWRVDFRGASAPVLFNGRLHLLGRTRDGQKRGERLAVFDAQTGALIWERRKQLYNTNTPFPRTAAASPVVDPETGNLITTSATGWVRCYGPDGTERWSHNFVETFGARIGYRGHLAEPLIEADTVIISFVTIGWGEDDLPRQRLFAMDKKTGEIRWIATPGGPALEDPAGTPVPLQIGARRMLVSPNPDGAVYALNAGTGRTEWTFRVAPTGIAAPPVVSGKRVYILHPGPHPENRDGGLLVCINGDGSGDISESGQLWRVNIAATGLAAPLLHGDNLFILNQAADLHLFDASSGRQWWTSDLGTRANAAPTFADGKLFAAASRGRILVLDPKRDQAVTLSEFRITPNPGRDAEVKAAPIPAYGRLYLITDSELLCLGAADAPFEPTNTQAMERFTAPEDTDPAGLQIVPAEADLEPGAKYHFRANLMDAQGRFIRQINPEWSLQGIQGKLTYLGEYNPADVADTGYMAAEWKGLRGKSRLRVFKAPPYVESFDDIESGAKPPTWVGAARPGAKRGSFMVVQIGANKVLEKPVAPAVDQTGSVYMGPTNASGYVIQADVMGFIRKRFLPDMGLYSHGYRLDLLGPGQQVILHTGGAGGSLLNAGDFAWEADTWYSMKLEVVYDAKSAVIRGKIWRAGDEEPKAWTISATDPQPTLSGSPGLYGLSRAKIHYDNIRITPR